MVTAAWCYKWLQSSSVFIDLFRYALPHLGDRTPDGRTADRERPRHDSSCIVSTYDAAKMVDSLCKLSYSKRLNSLGLTILGINNTLATRHLRDDLPVTETYKILTHKEGIDPNQFFLFSDTGYVPRGRSLKLYKPSVRLNVRKQFYSCRRVRRVIHFWNQLLQHVAEAPTVNTFKNRLDW